MTREEIFRVGSELRRLCNSHGFEVAVETLRKDFAHRILTSPYTDKVGREDTYHLNRALDELIGVFSTFIMAAEQDALNAEDDEAETN